jgi:hypothetical protein
LAIATAVIGGLAAATPSLAREKVGGATTIERDVSGSLPGETRKVARGDEVYADELIRTANLSAAKIQFIDKTNLSIGPLAAVKLDHFVYNRDSSARSMVVSVTKGALRWVSGLSDSKAYQIRTPVAIIGVRGTIFDLLVEPRRATLVLQEGAVEVCTTDRRRCKRVSRRGDVVTVTPGRIDGPRPGGPGPSDFASRCLGATERLNCTVLASAEPPSPRGRRRVVEKKPIDEPAVQPRPKRRIAKAPPPVKEARRPIRHPRIVVEREPIFEEEIVPIRPRRVVDVPLGRPWPPRIGHPRYPRHPGIGPRPPSRWPGFNGGGGFGRPHGGWNGGRMGGLGFGRRF